MNRLIEQLFLKTSAYFTASHYKTLGSTGLVAYAEPMYDPEANRAMRMMYSRLSIALKTWHYELFYAAERSLSDEELAYWNPMGQDLDPEGASQRLYEMMRMEKPPEGPALVFCIERRRNAEAYLVWQLDAHDPASSLQELLDMIVQAHESDIIAPTMLESASAAEPSIFRRAVDKLKRPMGRLGMSRPASEPAPSAPYWKKAARRPDRVEEDACALQEEDLLPDVPLSEEDERLIHEIEERLETLRRKGVPDSLLCRIMVREVKPSRLVITRDYRILLPDYNKEIKLVSGDKVLYFLLLRHPEGLYQKHLTDYVHEMEQIHLKMNNGFLTDRSRLGIEAIAYSDTACNQRISRIRKAFLAEMQEDLAKHYIPTAGRGQLRRIPLDTELIRWESLHSGWRS